MGDGGVAPALFDSGVASYSSGMSDTTTHPTGPSLCRRRRRCWPGGVSASMRLHPYLGRPLYVDRGEGAVSLRGRWQALHRLQHVERRGAARARSPRRQTAVLEGVELGIITAAETPFHERLAARLVEIIPAAERVRFSSVGSEVTLVALRIARHATGRTKYLKFDGHFHGLTEPWLYRRADPLDDAERGRPLLRRGAGRRCGRRGDGALERRRGLRARDCRARRRAGGRLLRADPLQRRLHSTRAGVPGAAAGAVQRAWHRLRHGRSALRVPHPPRRRAGAVRRHPGPDHARQGAGQWTAAVLRLRAGRSDAQPGADRSGRPQRYLLRASAQRAGRARHPRRAESARRLRPHQRHR